MALPPLETGLRVGAGWVSRGGIEQSHQTKEQNEHRGPGWTHICTCVRRERGARGAAFPGGLQQPLGHPYHPLGWASSGHQALGCPEAAVVGTGPGRGGCGVPANRRERNPNRRERSGGLAACGFPHPPRLRSLQRPRAPRVTCRLVLPLEKASLSSQGSLCWTEHSIWVFSYRLQCCCLRQDSPGCTYPSHFQAEKPRRREIHVSLVEAPRRGGPNPQVLTPSPSSLPSSPLYPSAELGLSTLSV